MRLPYDDEPEGDAILDPETGYAINLPLASMEPRAFWSCGYGAWAKDRILKLREDKHIGPIDDELDHIEESDTRSAFDNML